MDVIKNERGIGTGNTRNPTEPEPQADGKLPPTGSRNPIAEDPSAKKAPSRTPPPGRDEAVREPGKTPGKAEG